MGIAVLDIGTSSMRGILYDQKGEKLFAEQVCYAPMYLSDERVEQNPEDWKHAMETLLAACAKAAKISGNRIEAVSLTSQRSSVIAVDENGNPLGNAIMWQDKRVLPLLAELKPQEEFVFKKTGSRLNPVFSAPKMMWIRACMPQLYEKAQRLVVIPDYLIHELTGVWVTDATYASRSLLMNLYTRQWDSELLELFQVDREKLCPIVEPGSIVGTVTAEFAVKTGLEEGIPVISAGGDQQCAALGMGVLKSGNLEVSVGTGAYMIAASETVPEELKQDVICNASAIPNEYILECSILSCASVWNWFLKLMYGMTDKNRKEVYDLVNKEISDSLNQGEAPVLIPLFQGRGTPDWNSDARGQLCNLTLGSRREDLAKSVMEGLGYEIAVNLDTICRYMGDMERIILCGGLANSSVFCRILAGICGQSVSRYSDNEATGIGAWISAAVAMGWYETYEQAFRQAREGHQITKTSSEPELEVRYREGKKTYRELYERLCSK